MEDNPTPKGVAQQQFLIILLVTSTAGCVEELLDIKLEVQMHLISLHVIMKLA